MKMIRRAHARKYTLSVVVHWMENGKEEVKTSTIRITEAKLIVWTKSTEQKGRDQNNQQLIRKKWHGPDYRRAVDLWLTKQTKP